MRRRTLRLTLTRREVDAIALAVAYASVTTEARREVSESIAHALRFLTPKFNRSRFLAMANPEK